MDEIKFFQTAANLKKIKRQGWISKISVKGPESVADHTFLMAIIGMVISDYQNYDTLKILKMILLHDLAESKIGDIMPEQISKSEKYEIENKAFAEILSQLPDSLKSSYLKIWNEFQENNSEEAKIVHQIDKLEMALQAKIYQSDGYAKEKPKKTTASKNAKSSKSKKSKAKTSNRDFV